MLYHTISECGFENVDLIFALAVRPNITRSEFAAMMTYLLTVVERVAVDEGEARLGMFMFDTVVRALTVIELGEISTRQGLIDRIRGMEQIEPAGNASLLVGLTKLVEMFNNSHVSGGRDMDAVVIIDESTDLGGTDAMLATLNSLNVSLSVAAIGVSQSALQALTSEFPHIDMMPMLNFEVTARFGLTNMFKQPECGK